MDVFISWSGRQGQRIGRTLCDWLQLSLPGVVPWISSEDISPGANWVNTLFSKLETTKFCVICLTPENVRSPWLYFEAGAIAGRRGDARVCGYLTGVDYSHLAGGPLSLFQCVEASKDGTWKLVREINHGLTRPNDESLLAAGYEKHWPSLKHEIERALVETVATGDEKETDALKPVYSLSEDAMALLMDASEDANGRVYMSKTMHGLTVRTNNKVFSNMADPRSEAAYQAAIRELLRKGLLEGRGTRGEVFAVTAEGYRAADGMKANRGSGVPAG